MGGFVPEFLQILNRLDRPADDPNDDAEDIASLAEAGSLSVCDLRGVQDDDGEGDGPDP